MSQMYLHSDNFDLCRICLLEPEADRNVKFTRIFPVDNREDFTLQKQIEEIFGIKIGRDDCKPKIICENCLNLLSGCVEMKKKAAESTIIVNYLARSNIASATTSNARPHSSLNSNNEENSTRVKPRTNEREILPFENTIIKNEFQCKSENEQKVPLLSKHKLFTCLKPSCNLIFQNIYAFKLHHRKHFEYVDKFICWLCCVPFSTISDLRNHKMKDDCRTSGIFKCYQCSEKFNDLENFSIHKLTFHNGNLASGRNTKKTIKCAFCQEEILVIAFKDHLFTFH